MTEVTQDLGVRTPRRGWLLVSAWLLVVLYATGQLVPRVPSADMQVYILQPLLWLSLTALALWLWRREFGAAGFPADRWLVAAAVVVGLFQVAVFVLFGLLLGFGASPYARSPHWMALNMWFVLSRLAGQEVARWYLVVSLGRRRAWVGAAVAWLLLWVAAVPVSTYGAVAEGGERAFAAVGKRMLPAAAEGLLATYLAVVGGPLPSIAYRGTLSAFEWLSPILPDLRWTAHAFAGTLAPVLGVLVVRDLVEGGEQPAQERGARIGAGWVIAASLVVLVFWFNMGLFGVRPALISGVSMEPAMGLGDIAITREVAPGQVRVGDIVRFRPVSGRGSILHRVVEVRQEGGRYVFVTKGDNNNVEDKPWDETQLEGKLVVVVPKVGWVAIVLKTLLGRLFG